MACYGARLTVADTPVESVGLHREPFDELRVNCASGHQPPNASGSG
jgi:hypothetical protein